ncbi:membrane lipoprotein lipid attachment site-containing protein [Bacillus sonorensis]|uniref:Membrane protein YqiH n=2 Tax=Bacillus sonorensis TaxID=119858 RepID=M5P437_9BACI|nr:MULTISPECIES: membrane lipoprotein lipid attachment site-containing protein [Bacillus]TWK76052.1 Membrane-bound protein LytA [Bacillus paralicheniformis]ASB88517.1 Membrane-bound protein LytA [Bacillus sonorensis]EME74796.1 membrane protein YqiH [Bacillus sonorensis L12]MCZ0071833.1 membrane lipoprotein lipid attachment site-containing protein [Bacillus sonorensis]MCZ0090453.1 membrane lipoprotein lipid attachment site-containing protein [Bacillus sonorensis]
MKKGVIFVLFAMLLLAGCGTIQHEEQQSGDGSRKAEGGEWLKKEGTFIGLADQHTVAVNIDGKETMLQVPPEKRDKYKGIKEYTKVEVKYRKANDGTFQLKDLKKKE